MRSQVWDTSVATCGPRRAELQHPLEATTHQGLQVTHLKGTIYNSRQLPVIEEICWLKQLVWGLLHLPRMLLKGVTSS